MADHRRLLPSAQAPGASDGPELLLVCLAWVLVIGLAVVRLESRDGSAVRAAGYTPKRFPVARLGVIASHRGSIDVRLRRETRERSDVHRHNVHAEPAPARSARKASSWPFVSIVAMA